jgi:hypothetical protein
MFAGACLAHHDQVLCWFVQDASNFKQISQACRGIKKRRQELVAAVALAGFSDCFLSF